MALYKLTSRNNEKNLSVILETQNYRTLVFTEDNVHFENILELLEQEEQGFSSTDEVEASIINLIDENQALAKLMKDLDPNLTLGSYNKVLYKGHRLTYALQSDIYEELHEYSQNTEEYTKLHAVLNYVHKVYNKQEDTLTPDGVIEDNDVYAWLTEHGIGLTHHGNIRAVKANVGTLENMVTHDEGIKIGDKVLNRTVSVPDAGSFVVLPEDTRHSIYTEIETEFVDGIAERVMTHSDFADMTQVELLEYLQKSQQSVIQHLLNGTV